MGIKFDFSSYNKFKEIVEMKPEKEQIEKELELLFNSTGYKVLFEKEYNKEFFSNVVKFVLYPELMNTIDEVHLRRYQRYVKHFKSIISLSDEINKGIELITKESKKFKSNIENRAFSLLPYVQPEEVTVFVSVFDIDARGFGENSIVVDPIFCTHSESFAAIVAHELHHIYRNKQLCIKKEEVEERDRELIWLINQLQGEGIADQIDKEYFIFSKEKTVFPLEYVTQFTEEFTKARETISIINEYIERLYQTEEINKRKVLLKELRSKIALGGHPVAFYMAMIIIKEMFFDELVSNVGNPFSFITLYNKAAKQDKEPLPLFSEKAIKYLTELEEKYCK